MYHVAFAAVEDPMKPVLVFVDEVSIWKSRHPVKIVNLLPSVVVPVVVVV
jgi:hypothetical protein